MVMRLGLGPAPAGLVVGVCRVVLGCSSEENRWAHAFRLIYIKFKSDQNCVAILGLKLLYLGLGLKCRGVRVRSGLGQGET